MKNETENKIENRNYAIKCEMRADEETSLPVLVGMPIVYDSRSNNLGFGEWEFYETILQGAATEALKTSDIRALWNHSAETVPLGRNRSNIQPNGHRTLELREMPEGVESRIYPPDTDFGRGVVQAVERGDVSEMSFAFLVGKQTFTEDSENKIDYRTIETFSELFDISPVVYAAYPETNIVAEARARDRTEAQKVLQQLKNGDGDANAEILYNLIDWRTT
jgi:HK97 family phage prohead protease